MHRLTVSHNVPQSQHPNKIVLNYSKLISVCLRWAGSNHLTAAWQVVKLVSIRSKVRH